VGIHISFKDLLHFLDMTLATTLRDKEFIDFCLQTQMNRFAALRFYEDGICPEVRAQGGSNWGIFARTGLAAITFGSRLVERYTHDRVHAHLFHLSKR
jgi:hypothetical protein